VNVEETDGVALARFADYRFRTENFTATVPTGAGRIALRVRYWPDAAGLLRRVEARMGGRPAGRTRWW
jgi:hypothetical protein